MYFLVYAFFENTVVNIVTNVLEHPLIDLLFVFMNIIHSFFLPVT